MALIESCRDYSRTSSRCWGGLVRPNSHATFWWPWVHRTCSFSWRYVSRE